jgi:hypothetical protein
MSLFLAACRKRRERGKGIGMNVCPLVQILFSRQRNSKPSQTLVSSLWVPVYQKEEAARICPCSWPLVTSEELETVRTRHMTSRVDSQVVRTCERVKCSRAPSLGSVSRKEETAGGRSVVARSSQAKS